MSQLLVPCSNGVHHKKTSVRTKHSTACSTDVLNAEDIIRRHAADRNVIAKCTQHARHTGTGTAVWLKNGSGGEELGQYTEEAKRDEQHESHRSPPCWCVALLVLHASGHAGDTDEG